VSVFSRQLARYKFPKIIFIIYIHIHQLFQAVLLFVCFRCEWLLLPGKYHQRSSNQWQCF